MKGDITRYLAMKGQMFDTENRLLVQNSFLIGDEKQSATANDYGKECQNFLLSHIANADACKGAKFNPQQLKLDLDPPAKLSKAMNVDSALEQTPEITSGQLDMSPKGEGFKRNDAVGCFLLTEPCKERSIGSKLHTEMKGNTSSESVVQTEDITNTRTRK
ncbi:unnamed protein product [Caretta caretta]